MILIRPPSTMASPRPRSPDAPAQPARPPPPPRRRPWRPLGALLPPSGDEGRGVVPLVVQVSVLAPRTTKKRPQVLKRRASSLLWHRSARISNLIGPAKAGGRHDPGPCASAWLTGAVMSG